MFILKGRYLETTSYFSKKENKTVQQAVIYSEGDGQTHKITGLDTKKLQPFSVVEVPCVVGVYDGKLFVRKLDI